MPHKISLNTAIDIATKAKIQRDQLGAPMGIDFDAKPEEVYEAVRLLASNVGMEQWAKEELKNMSANLRSTSDDLYSIVNELLL